MSPDDLIEKVQNYFFTDEGLVIVFEKFVADNASKIDLSSEENKLIYTDIYEDYKQLFEKSLVDYIEKIGSTVHEFYNALNEKTDLNENSSDAIFGQILASVIDFDIFMVMMRDGAKRYQHK